MDFSLVFSLTTIFVLGFALHAYWAGFNRKERYDRAVQKRKARLAKAAYRKAHPNPGILEMILDFGFEHLQEIIAKRNKLF
jgi:hypothetical protein